MSNIVVLIGSSRKNGNTDLLAQSFIKGAKENENKIDIISVADTKINGCLGCNACFTNGNKCVQNDGMNEIYARMGQADILVVASPLYFFSIGGQLKSMIDRLHNPIRDTFSIKKLVFLGVCASSNTNSFDAVKVMFEHALDFFKLENGGFLTALGMHNKGDILQSEVLQQAYALGKNV